MKKKVIFKSLLMGICVPGGIYLAAGALDIITQESSFMLWVMFFTGIILFLLPMFFLSREKKLNLQAPTKLAAPAYLLGYAAVTAALLYIVDAIDTEKVFHHRYLGGIGLTILLIILTLGLGWAVLFRVITAIVRLIRKAANKTDP